MIFITENDLDSFFYTHTIRVSIETDQIATWQFCYNRIQLQLSFSRQKFDRREVEEDDDH